MPVEITQADRDDYAEFARMISRVTAKDADAIRAGEWDDTKDVRWFAERRVSRSTSTEEVERLRNALQSIAGETDTVAEFEGMAFRNFAADVLAGRPVTTWAESAWPPRTALGATSHVE